MFVVCGEALFDVFAAGDTPTGMALDARIGGSPFNVAVGLRRFNAVAAPVVDTAKAAKAALPVFKQYREADGQFYFKLVSAEGQVLLQSAAFAGGRDAGQWVARLKREGAAALAEAPVQRGEGVDEAALSAALLALQAADAA